MPGYGKASIRRCSTPTASIDNAVRGPAHSGLSLQFNLLGASGMLRLGVAALDNGMTIACEPRLDAKHS